MCVCVCVCVWSWLMGVNGLGGKWQKDVTLKRDWHLTNYLLQWSSSRANICALVQTGGMGSIWESPLPFISPSLCPFPPAALSRQGSTGTQWPCRRRGKKKTKKKPLSISHFRLLLLRATEECEAERWQTNSGAMIAKSFENSSRMRLNARAVTQERTNGL